MGNSTGKIGKGDNSQIFDALVDHRLLRCENRHNLGRKDLHRQQKNHRNDNGKAKGDSHNLFDGSHILFSPVLGSEHRRAGGKAENKQRQNKLHLSRQGGSGKDGFPDPAQHDHVGGGHGYVNQILQGDWEHQSAYCFVKVFGFQLHKNYRRKSAPF